MQVPFSDAAVKMRHMLANNRILLIGIGLAAASWPLEAAVEAFAFHYGTFTECLYSGSVHEYWMRLLTACLLVTFSLYAQHVIKRHRRIVLAMRESEECSRAMFEQAAVGIAMTDALSGRFLKINKKHGDLVGLTPEALIGMTFMEITHPDDLKADLANMERLRRGEVSEFSLEKRFLHKNGTLVWVNLTVTPMWEIGEKPRYHIAVVEDISERKRAEEALRLTQFAVDRSSDAIYWVRADGRISYANRSACEQLGYSYAELVSMSVSKIDPDFPQEDWPAHWDEMKRAGVKTFEAHHQTKDGEVFPVEITTNYLVHQGEEYIWAYVRNITELRQADAERVRLSTAIDQAAEAVEITDREGTIQYVNPAFERISGYTRQEALGQSPRIHKSGKHEESFYKTLWDTITRGETWKGRFTNRKKDGTLYEEEATISPVHDVTGTITNFVAIKRDVTREVALEAQLRQAQRMEAIGQLASGIAHDFDNLLTAITGYVSLARNTLPKDHKALGSLRGIEEAADHASGTTRSLLTLSHNMVMEKEPVELNDLFENSVRMLRRMLPANIDIVAGLDGESVWVRADGTQLRQVVINLAINARDAMQDGGVLRISVSRASASESRLIQPEPRSVNAVFDSAVCLVVSDTGMGMAPEVQEHIFDPFFTTKPREQGTGLGLAITHGIVKDHGGIITAESELGQGSTFTVVLPALGPDAIAEVAKPSPGAASRGQSEMVLLAEGDQHVRGIIAEALRSFGYVLVEATDEDSVTKVFERHRSQIRLLVIDLDSSRASGHNWLRSIRGDGTQTPAILIAGEVDSDLEDQLDENTFLLRKPFQMSELGVLVGRVISGMRREKAPS